MLAILTILLLCWGLATLAMFYFSPRLSTDARRSLKSWEFCRLQRLGVIFTVLVLGFIALPALEAQIALLLGLTFIYSLSTTLYRC